MTRTVRWIAAVAIVALALASPAAHASSKSSPAAIAHAPVSAAIGTRTAQIRSDVPIHVTPANRVQVHVVPSVPPSRAPVVPAIPAVIVKPQPAVVAAAPRPVAAVVVKPRPVVVTRPAPVAKPGPQIAPPVWHQASCDNLYGSGSVDIPDVAGVFYDLDFVPITAGPAWLDAGMHTINGYAARQVKTWTFTVDDLSAQCGPPATDTTPNAGDIPPVWIQATCDTPAGSVEIPTVEGVTYSLDTIPSPGGVAQLSTGLHTVTATSDADPSRLPTWTFTVTDMTGHC